MDLDFLIEKLNAKIVAAGHGFEKLNIQDLDPAEQALVKKYRPDTSLIIYGTLAPGRSNHSEVENIKGEWKKGMVKGKLLTVGDGYVAFQHAQTGEEENIEAFVLFSEEWMDNWCCLDEFEGEDYLRILAKYELNNGEIGIGNIYASRKELFD